MQTSGAACVYHIDYFQAHSQVWIGGGAFWEQVDFFKHFLGAGGFLRVFSDIVDFSTYFLRESGLFRAVTAGPKGMDKDTF